MLLVGLFDGIGALRVAMDLQGVQVIGYISVEKELPSPAGGRVPLPWSGAHRRRRWHFLRGGEEVEFALLFPMQLGPDGGRTTLSRGVGAEH